MLEMIFEGKEWLLTGLAIIAFGWVAAIIRGQQCESAFEVGSDSEVNSSVARSK